MKEIQSVAIVGLGAIGAGYAAHIMRNAPEITLYGVVRDMDAYWGDPIVVNDTPVRIDYRTYDSLAETPVDLILLAVKSYHLAQVIRSLGPVVKKHTIIVSLMNGLVSEEELIRTFGPGHVIHAAVVHADTNRDGHHITCADIGRVCFGVPSGGMVEQQQALASFFTRCRIPCERSRDILLCMWRKLLVNVGFNQTSTVYQLTYGEFLKNKPAMDTMRAAQEEVIRLGNRCGIALSQQDIKDWERTLAQLSYNGRSSMLQDFWMNRPLEEGILGDYVCNLGEKMGVDMSTNRWLRDRIQTMVKERNAITSSDVEIRGLSTRQGHMDTPTKIANRLRTDIIRAKYAPGEKLAEAQLAKQFDASRSSVRTALQTLSSEGLIRTHPNGRREVVEFTPRQIQDLYDVRWLLENRALELLFEKGRSVYPELAQILGEIEARYAQGDKDSDFCDLDISFHRALVRAADNLFLTNAWEGSTQMYYAMMNFNILTDYGPRYMREFFEKHYNIYEMLLSGDRAAFPELRRHIMEAKDISVRVMKTIKQF